MTQAENAPFKSPWLTRYLKKKIEALESKLFKKSLGKFLKTEGTVLDVPSEDGLLLPILLAHNLTVYAVNSLLSADDKNRWKGNKAHPVTFQQMDLKKLNFPDNAFDYITSRELLESCSVEARERRLSELNRVSRNILFIAVRTSGFSLLGLLCQWAAPDLWQPSLLSSKELHELLSRQPHFQLIDFQSAGGLNPGVILAVLQKV